MSTSKRRNVIVWSCLVVILAISLLVAVWPDGQAPTAQSRIDSLSMAIQCPTCQGLSVAESDSPIAVNAREEISRQVSSGRSDQEVKDFFVSRYGPSALLAPEKSGIALIAWLGPVVFGLAALIALVLIVGKWRSRPETALSLQDQSEEGEFARDEMSRSVSESDRPKPTLRRIAVDRRAVLGACSVVGLVIALLLGLNATQRGAQDEITGGFTADTNTLLAEANRFTAENKPVEALKRYDTVLERDPANAQALAYRGWLIRLAGQPTDGLASVDRAIQADPNYVDAYFFRGYMRMNDQNDPQNAVSDFEKFLSLDAPADLRPLVESALADAKARVASQ